MVTYLETVVTVTFVGGFPVAAWTSWRRHKLNAHLREHFPEESRQLVLFWREQLKVPLWRRGRRGLTTFELEEQCDLYRRSFKRDWIAYSPDLNRFDERARMLARKVRRADAIGGAYISVMLLLFFWMMFVSTES